MTDVLTRKQRSFNMSRIRGKNTEPELLVRRIVYSMGFRYRLHGRGLPGRPDLVFGPKRRVIFVHGCYWHMHDCRFGRVVAQTNAKFWAEKRQANADRDCRNLVALRHAGWQILVVWECETRNIKAIRQRIRRFLRREITTPARTRTPAAPRSRRPTR